MQNHPTPPIARSAVVATIATLTLAWSAYGGRPRTPSAAGDSARCAALRSAEVITDPDAAHSTATVDLYPVLPKYALRQMSDTNVRILRALLRGACWPQARELYFTNYQAEIPDWIVYVDSSGRATQSFDIATYEAPWYQSSQSPVLKGQRFVYVVFFSDQPLDTLVKADTSVHQVVRMRRRVEAFQSDPILKSLIVSLGSILHLGTPPADTSLQDSTATAPLLPASDGHEHIFAALERFGLLENAEYDLSVTPGVGMQFPWIAEHADMQRLEGVHINIANAREHLFEAGGLVAISGGRRAPTLSGDTVTGYGQNMAVNVYGMLALNLGWFENPIYTCWNRSSPRWQRVSVGPFVATNLVNNVGDEIVGGILVGHIFGDGGIALGADWAPHSVVANSIVRNERWTRWLLGLALPF